MPETINHASPESSANKEKIQSFFNETRLGLEELLGLKLTNIEFVGLKRVVEAVVNQVEQERREMTSATDRISDYYIEIYNRWFLHFYDMRYEDLPLDNKCNIDEATKEYFRRKQAEQYLI